MEEYPQMEVSWLDLPLAASPWPIQLLAITLLTLIGAVMVWKLVGWQAKSLGHTFNGTYWPIIKTNPFAVVLYRLGVYGMFTAIATTLLSRFA